jgi:Uncharacterized conserved protein, contains RING Zn-finger
MQNYPPRRKNFEEPINLNQLVGLDEQKAEEPIQNNLPTDPNAEMCVICLEKAADAIFAPCAHKCCCARDAWIVFNRNRTCPMCRKDLEGVINTVLAQTSTKKDSILQRDST